MIFQAHQCASLASLDQKKSNRSLLHCSHVVLRPSKSSRMSRVSCNAAAVSLKTTEYNKLMSKKMKWTNPYEYYFDRGLYYHEIMPNLICGSQPRNRDDVKQMRKEIRVDTIINLQQDKDLAYWNVSLKDIESECGVQSINFIRKPAQDFDPHSLRKVIPGAAASLHQALQRGERVYVHCTAGLGRSPALCIAYMFWSAPSRLLSSLDESYDDLTRQRPCGPNRDAIRGATFDLLDLRRDPGVFETLPKDAYATLDEKDRRRIWDILLTEQKRM